MTTEFTPLEQKEALNMLLASMNLHLKDTALNNSTNSFFENSRLEDADFVRGLVFKNVSYDLNNNLCLETNKNIIILLDISDETITIKKEKSEPNYEKMLMPLKMLWFSFEVYRSIKGKNKYYQNSYNNSCIRHIYDIEMERYGWRDKMEKYVASEFEQSLRFELN